MEEDFLPHEPGAIINLKTYLLRERVASEKSKYNGMIQTRECARGVFCLFTTPLKNPCREMNYV